MKKLALRRETVRRLAQSDLARVVGGIDMTRDCGPSVTCLSNFGGSCGPFCGSVNNLTCRCLTM